MRSKKMLVFAIVFGLVFAGVAFADGATLIAPGSSTLAFLAQNGVNTSRLTTPGASVDATTAAALHRLQVTDPDGLRDRVNDDLTRAVARGYTNVEIKIGPYRWSLSTD